MKRDFSLVPGLSRTHDESMNHQGTKAPRPRIPEELNQLFNFNGPFIGKEINVSFFYPLGGLVSWWWRI
jgi:hypothetical protein